MRRLAAAAGAALALLAAAPGSAEAVPADSLTISPSRAAGIAVEGQRLGPFRFLNTTLETFRGRAFAVLLEQARDGGIRPRSDAASLAQARRMLDVPRAGFPFGPGAREALAARLRRPTEEGSFYGGIVFQAQPSDRSEAAIRQVLQLTATLFLRPAPRLQRAQVAGDGLRAEQDPARPERLRLLAGVRNEGNVDVHPRGHVTVRDEAGSVAARVPVRGLRVLPGAVVDLPAPVAKSLEAGRYTLTARLRAGGKRLVLRSAMTLYARDELAVRDGALLPLDEPEAWRGEPVAIDTGWKNTGNVRWAPEATAELRRVGTGGLGPVVRRVPLELAAAAPGGSGRVRGKVALPDEGSYELTVRLAAGGRELHARSVSVTARDRPALAARLLDWVAANQLLAATVVAALILAAALLGAGAAARAARRRAVRTPGGSPAPPATGQPMPPAPPAPPALRPASVPAAASGPLPARRHGAGAGPAAVLAAALLGAALAAGGLRRRR